MQRNRLSVRDIDDIFLATRPEECLVIQFVTLIFTPTCITLTKEERRCFTATVKRYRTPMNLSIPSLIPRVGNPFSLTLTQAKKLKH